ncbi:hypothetical protein BGW80DRAFT_910538 [Lactifluus volemus]|nr:hypothetical protein BGW80DRAFT_910538 [Lactifluus volemus]
MLSLKITLLAFAFFATLSYAIPSSPRSSKDPKALITDASARIVQTFDPFYHVPPNAKPDYLASILNELQWEDILVLVATLIKDIIDPIVVACGSYSDLTSLLNNLITVLVQLVDVVLAVVGVSVAELVLLLIRNGCAATILGLNLSGLIQCFGLRELSKV